MGDEINGDKKDRLDQLAEQLEGLANRHIEFRKECDQMLKGLAPLRDQVPVPEMKQKIDDVYAQLAPSQRYADEKMAELMITVKLFLRPLE